MMFLEYAIWGSWTPVLSAYLRTDLGFSGIQVGVIYSMLPLATILSPFIGGQIADRNFASQKVIAVLHLAGGIILLALSRITHYYHMVWLMFVFSLIYAPTVALTSSLAFRNLTNSAKEFGWIRVGGTLGWIAAGMALTGWRILANKYAIFSIPGDTFLLAGVLSLVMSLYALFLPHTPPRKEGSNPLALVEAIKLLRDKQTLAFCLVAFLVSIELMSYNVVAAPFLTSANVGISQERVAGVMAVSQIAEIFVMAFLLPYYLPRFGTRRTIILGLLVWPIRYCIFGVGAPVWVLVASLSLSGFYFVFLCIASQIYVDTVAPRDIRASVQSLFTLLTTGAGMYLGSIFAGWIQNEFSVIGTAGNLVSTNWNSLFIVFCALTSAISIGLIIFLMKRLNYVPKTNM